MLSRPTQKRREPTLGTKIKSGKGAIMVPWTNGLNCYSFAAKCDMPGGTGAVSCVPGARAGASVSGATIDKKSLYGACVADGFEDVSGGVIGSDYKFKNPPHFDNAHYLVAVFYDNRHSFHFARQLADGSKKTNANGCTSPRRCRTLTTCRTGGIWAKILATFPGDHISSSSPT